jgi:hypothetical protein
MKDTNTALAFGLNEVVLTLLCAFTGFLDKSQKEILYVLAVTAVASSIPDVYSYYDEEQNEDKLSRSQAARRSVPVFVAELLGAVVLSLPLVFFKNRNARTAGTFIMGMALIVANETFLQKNSAGRVAEVMVSVSIAVFTSYVLVSLIKRLFKMF